MSLPYVRRFYKVPAFRGRVIHFEGRPAQIMSATAHLHVRFLDARKPRYGWLHPTWHTDYTEVPDVPTTATGTR